MDIRVSGHQIDTGEALQTYVADRLNAMVEKYFSRALSSQVTFGKGAHGAFTSDIVTHVNKGLISRAWRRSRWHFSFERLREAGQAFGATTRIRMQLRPRIPGE